MKIKQILIVVFLLTNTSVFAQNQVQVDALRENNKNLFEKETTPQCPREIKFLELIERANDIKFSLCYSLQEIKKQNYPAALSSLERTLVINPHLDQIRLLYASILYRIGSINEAQIEFNKIRQDKLKASDKQKIQKFVDILKRAQKPTRHSLSFLIGTHFDTNRNAAPSDDLVLVGGNQFTLGTDSQKDEDWGILSNIGYQLVHDFGKLSNHRFLFSVSYLKDEQFDRDELDLDGLTSSLGFRLDADSFYITPLINFSKFQLAGKQFLDNTGASVRFDKALRDFMGNRTIDSWLTLSFQDDDFRNTAENPILENRNGSRYEIESGAALNLSPKHRLSFNLAYLNKNASAEFQSFNQFDLEIQHSWSLFKRSFLLTSLNAGVRKYREADSFISSQIKRRETPIRLDSSFNMPILTNCSITALKDINLSIGAQYLHQDSNIINFDYNNFRGQFFLSKTYNF